MTQCERLLAYLKDHHEIDPLTAWAQLGIYRLGARVFDLRAAGHEIESERKEVTNRFGESCNVGCYKLRRVAVEQGA